MHVIILLLTIFLAPTPTQKAVQVVTRAYVVDSPEACKATEAIYQGQARQDPKILDIATGCFEVSGDAGKAA